MSAKRNIEIYSVGCPVCQEAISTIQDNACPSCEVTILDMNDPNMADRAKRLGVESVPAIVIDGQLTECCSGRGPDIEALKAAGLGVPLIVALIIYHITDNRDGTNG